MGRAVNGLSQWAGSSDGQARIQDRRSGGGHIAEGAPFSAQGAPFLSEGAPFFAQVGAKSYRGAPIFASWGGWELKILGLTDLV